MHTMLEKIWKRETYNYLWHTENQEQRSLDKYNKGLIVSKMM